MFLRRIFASGWVGAEGEGGKGDRVNPIPRRVLTRPIPPKVGSTDLETYCGLFELISALFRLISAYLSLFRFK